MQKIQDRITTILDYFGVETDEIEFEEVAENGKIRLNILLPEEKAKHFIGSKGETLQALELLVRLAHKDELEGEERLIIDINGYRKEREEQLQTKAIEIGRQVLERGMEYVFNNLNSYERFLVHSTIGEDPELSQKLETFSEDDTYGRVLVIRIKQVDDNQAEKDEKTEEEVPSEA